MPIPEQRLVDLPGRLQPVLAGRYRLDRKLGRGGMATVYLAQDLRHRRPRRTQVAGARDVRVEIGPEMTAERTMMRDVFFAAVSRKPKSRRPLWRR